MSCLVPSFPKDKITTNDSREKKKVSEQQQSPTHKVIIVATILHNMVVHHHHSLPLIPELQKIASKVNIAAIHSLFASVVKSYLSKSLHCRLFSNNVVVISRDPTLLFQNGIGLLCAPRTQDIIF